MLTIKKYNPEYFDSWNFLVGNSKNGTFLHNRDFMEYHSDKYIDFSLLVIDNDKVAAVLPANISNDTLISHQGLTFGGLIMTSAVTLSKSIIYVFEILKFLNKNKITKLVYKPAPIFYNLLPSGEIDYCLFLLKAKLFRRDTGSVIDLSSRVQLQERRKRGIKLASRQNIEVRKEQSFLPFWEEILVPNLRDRFGLIPVHSINEIERLANIFSENIKQYSVYIDNKIVAGTTIFETPSVAHSQYISASQTGKLYSALDFLFEYLISQIFSDKKYFSFGVSNENNGKEINYGLLDWKEGFGARTICHDFYEINTINYKSLEKYIV